MHRKQKVLIVALIIIIAGIGWVAWYHFEKSRLPEPAPVHLSETQDPTLKEAEEAAKVVDPLIDKARGLLGQKQFEVAIKLLEQIKVDHGSKLMPINDQFELYGEYLDHLIKNAHCMKRRNPESGSSSLAQVQSEWITALQSKKTSSISRLLRCDTFVGVPFSEFDMGSDPEKLAEQLSSHLPKSSQKVRVSQEIENGVVLEGFVDGEVRVFWFKKSGEETPLWYVGSIMHGDAKSIREALESGAGPAFSEQ